MSSFQDLQSIAAARAEASQRKLAAEREQKQLQEQERKAASEIAERKRIQQERLAYAAREQRKRQEAEEAQRRREEARIAKEAAEKKRQEEALARIRSGNGSSSGKDASSSQEKGKNGSVDMKAFAAASKKAIERAGGSSRKGKERETENEDGFIRSKESSTLTREEKRLKRERAMLGLESKRGSSTSQRSKKVKSGLVVTQKGAHLPGSDMHAELLALGRHRRDKRTVDEIERELRAAKMAARSPGSDAAQARAAKRQEAELEAMLRRKRAMEGKYGAELRGGTETSSNGQSSHLDRQAGANHAGQGVKSKPRIYKTSLGLTAADYLPGAPIRADRLPAVRKANEAEFRDTRSDKEFRRAAPAPATPPAQETKKRETVRDRFLREEAERKARQKQSAASQRFEEESDEDDEEDDEDEYESEGEEEASAAGDVREEIWKIFGRDRKKYISHADDDSDDDMEADMNGVAREEARSSRLARLEDEREEREEARRQAEKAARKRARLSR